MRISDWSSDVCSSDLLTIRSPSEATSQRPASATTPLESRRPARPEWYLKDRSQTRSWRENTKESRSACLSGSSLRLGRAVAGAGRRSPPAEPWRRTASAQPAGDRSEEHTSELQSLMRISYAVFCLKKKNNNNQRTKPQIQ